ncbi:MAG: T9SS type A sorting domain-containing protein [Ignavibacteriae bacterium]|nr:T9SS type A sorting domain-containing protein [Ignavibacteriota bacterium]
MQTFTTTLLIIVGFLTPVRVMAQNASNYIYSSTTASYTPISGSTLIFGSNIDEQISQPIDIGFSFKYSSAVFTQIQVSSNGFIRLGTGSTDPAYLNDLASTTTKPVLASLWDDLRTGISNGKIHYVLSGSSPTRILTIEFKAMQWDFNGVENGNFQIRLYETSNRIEFIYGDFGVINNTSGGASIGINDLTGGSNHFLSITPGTPATASSTIANNSINSGSALSSGTTYRFAPPFENDIEVFSIDTPVPGSSIQIRSKVAPAASIRNIGSVTQTDVPVRYEIVRNSDGSLVYSNAKVIPSIDPLSTVQVKFDTLDQGLSAGTYMLKLVAQLSTDSNRNNDTLWGIIFVNWISAEPMANLRFGPTATLLLSGNVLVTGGEYNVGVRSTSELYDTHSAAWISTDSMAFTRQRHTATLLPTGKVLVVGGSYTDTCEIFDPVVNRWSKASPTANRRYGHTATLLADGKVLVAGGGTNSCEFYDVASGSWRTTGPMSASRTEHTATQLTSGKVLVAGGRNNSCEVYNPDDGTWSTTGSMYYSRAGHTATLLSNGKVLVTGGYTFRQGEYNTPLKSCELYDPDTGIWALTGELAFVRFWHSATLLANRKVLVTGGKSQGRDTYYTYASCEVFDPDGNTWTNSASMSAPRSEHPATLLRDGRVLVTGGGTADCEIYDYEDNVSSVIEIRNGRNPSSFELKQNYPNPFNPFTAIEFMLPYSIYVNLRIYNLLGQEVATLVSQRLSSGTYHVKWHASDYASGVYFFRLEAGQFIETRKVILIR